MSAIRKWDFDSEQDKRQCLDKIVTRINESTDEDIGLLAAEDVLAIVGQHLGPEIYNKAIAYCQTIIEAKLTDLNVDLDLLRQQ